MPSMRSVEVTLDEHGYIRIAGEADDPEMGFERVLLTPEQAPVVAQWLIEAAGASAPRPAEGRKVAEVRAMANLFRRLEQQMRLDRSQPDDVSEVSAVRASLEWAVGDVDVSPEDRYFRTHDETLAED